MQIVSTMQFLSIQKEAKITILSDDENSSPVHTENSISNLSKFNQIRIVITLFESIWHKTEFSAVLNQLVKFDYNPKLV